MSLAQRVLELTGGSSAEELIGGHQARAYLVRGPRPNTCGDRSSDLVAKVYDDEAATLDDLGTRLAVTEDVSRSDPAVCRPVPVGGRLLNVLGDGAEHVACFEFADGSPPDPAVPGDAVDMGTTLATLHVALADQPARSLPLVAALRVADPAAFSDLGGFQLLHGDFHADNLRRVDGALRVFDLDDCGYGPAGFDVANTLYTVRFDAAVNDTPELYDPFRESFIAGYDQVSQAPADDVLDRLVDLRIAALAHWLEHPADAPAWVRTASAAWLRTLGEFAAANR